MKSYLFMTRSLGPVVLSLNALELDAEEREILQHPLVAGVILFARNYDSPAQISELCRRIHAVRRQPILISVDHEGGRVQRFRKGFTSLPAMRELGRHYAKNANQALITATACGWLMAAELFSVGVNLSFAPVLDLDKRNQAAIGDRAFNVNPDIVIELAKAFISGMHQVGMMATGKHFPGHGDVTIDSHKAMPEDVRGYAEINTQDMQPFIKLIEQKILDAVMPAHILFSTVDDKPVGFSDYWLKTILREQLQFEGIIISDDLNMEGAAFAGDYLERARLALRAGCDVILICNNRKASIQILDGLPHDKYLLEDKKVNILLGGSSLISDYTSLRQSKMWKEKNECIVKFNEQVEACKI